MPPGILCVSTLDTLKETPSLMNVNANVQEQKQIETLYQVNKARCGVLYVLLFFITFPKFSKLACMTNSEKMNTYLLVIVV